MSSEKMNIVFIGLSVTSSWGNGHATTYRGLIHELVRRGHQVTFLERDVPWYAAHRDMPTLPAGTVNLYNDLDELKLKSGDVVKNADIVIVGSYVPEGIEVGEWVLKTAQGKTAFYDIDTPETLAHIASHSCTYISEDQIRRYNIYFSFTGGKILDILERVFNSPRARPLYCSVNASHYYPEQIKSNVPRYDLGYLGTYCIDRQQALTQLMIEPASKWKQGKFIVAGPQYPETVLWPDNIVRCDHIPPDSHRCFYNSQRFTLNITRQNMKRFGYSPSVRLFEAAACGVPIISDYWEGLETIFSIDNEILITQNGQDTLRYLSELSDDNRFAIGMRARQRILKDHTAEKRAQQLEEYLLE